MPGLSVRSGERPGAGVVDYSTFSIYGEVNELYSDGPPGSPAIFRDNELE